MKIKRIATIFLLGILLVSGLACELVGGAEATPTPTPTPTPTGTSAASPLTTSYGASLKPHYDPINEQVYFLLTAWAKEPVNLFILNPDGSELAAVYIPPKIELGQSKEKVDLPPAPSGGTYTLDMYSEITGEHVWQGAETFKGPNPVIMEWSLNPVWVRGEGWDLQHLTMTIANTGDMPIILYGLKLKLEKDDFSTEEITVERAGEAQNGWHIQPRTQESRVSLEGAKVFISHVAETLRTENLERRGLDWGLTPWEKPGDGVEVIPWGSKEQQLFGQYLSPGKYTLYFTLSDHFYELEENELNFVKNPAELTTGFQPIGRN